MPVQKKSLAPVKGAAAAKARSSSEDETAPAAPKAKRGLASLEEVFDSTPAGSGVSWPEGEFKARITMLELTEKENSDAISACVTYTGHEDEEEDRVRDKDAKQWYQLMKDDGSPGAGIGFLKGDLEALGYPDVRLTDLEEVFKKISDEEPEVLVKVKQNGKYTNLYLQKVLTEDED